ncbi:MAG: hypothetical protein K2I30_03995 [Clostridia bacterium]|nr:hypothetical protein [Clostridia bacterium]
MGTLKLNSNTVSEIAREQATAALEVEACAESLKQTEPDEKKQTTSQATGKICGMREATFSDAKGAEKKIIYSSPTFYRNEASGEYAEIKNELTDIGEEIVNSENFYEVRFDKRLKGGKIFDVTKCGKKVSLYTADAAACTGRSSCTCGLCREDNSVTYVGLNGADIHYTAFNDKIKEDIIITQRQENYVYNFKLDVGDMTVEEGDNCSLLLKDVNTGEVMFEIPAPYMYDANGVRSYDVEYEFDVNGGELGLKVTASAEFINAEERAFPVTIDPQIILTPLDLGVFELRTIYWQSGDEDTITDDILLVTKTGNHFGEIAEVFINKKAIGEIEGNVSNVTLILTAKPTGVGEIEFEGYNVKRDGDVFKVDITDNFLSKYDSIYVLIKNKELYYEKVEFEFYTRGEFAPKLCIEYEKPKVPETDEFAETSEPNYKELVLGDRVTGYFNLNDGMLTAAFNSADFDLTVPVSLIHVHRKQKAAVGNAGVNWRLNLQRSLTVSESDNQANTVLYYLDELSDGHRLEEKYYVLNDGVKKFVNKNEVDISINGQLTYSGKEVLRQSYCKGFTLVPEINDFKGVEFLELRQEEEAELETFVQSYYDTLSNYVVYDIEVKEISSDYDLIKFSKSNYMGILNQVKKTPNHILLPKSEALQLQVLNDSVSQLKFQLMRFTDKTLTEYGLLFKQLNADNAQIDFIIEQANNNLPKLQDAFEKYFNKKAQLELLKKQTPVNYLKDENGHISGFNAQGNLVCIFDAYENYVAIDYDAKNRISALTDNAGKTVKFKYENDLLQSVTDNRGRTVSYAYDGAALKSVTFADGKTLSFKYKDNNFRTIQSSDGYEAKFNFIDGKLSSVTNTGATPKTGTISELTFTYTDGTAISDSEGNVEKFTFYNSKRIKSHAVTDGALVTTTTNYEYANDGGKQTKAVTSSNVDDKTTTFIERLNDLELPVSRTEDWQKISDTVSVKTVTEYSYDNEDKLIKQTVTKFTKTLGAEPPVTEKTSVANYHYDANGSLILTESFVVGEEQTGGVNYEQKVYNKHGAVVKEIKWNSLDSSSRFYTETDLADDGRVLAEKDETGEICAEYEYANGTSTPNAVKYANGSKFAYGRNGLSDTVTSVTQSTEDGEANVTDITYQYGLPVTVKSGNTQIEYGYDAKGRKTSVKVNGTLQSSYTYGKFVDTGTSVDFGEYKQVFNVNGSDVKIQTQKTASADAGQKVRKVRERQLINGKVEAYTKEYNTDGTLGSVVIDGTTTVNYSYDKYGKLVAANTMKSGEQYMNEVYTYNANAELTKKAVTGAAAHTYTFEYKNNAARDLDYIAFGNYQFKPLTDVNGRNTGREILGSGTNYVAAEYISYRKVGDHATNMPSTVWYRSGMNIKDSIKYKYDKCGNITEVIENGHTTAKYTYDDLNRIVREDNKPLNKTVLYAYDNNGNITERCEYSYTSKTSEELTELNCIHYDYDYRGDKILSYNGELFRHNGQGCPVGYRSKSMTWKYGRLLESYNGTNFYYDGLGRRTRKGDISYVYDNDGRLIKQSNGLEFIYDAGGVIGVKYNNIQYFYRRDARGNIIAVLDSSGTVVVKYIYDAWGNHAVVDRNGEDIDDMTNIGNMNPFRYNGYYYDVETGFYYLKSRYYDPELGRFVSQDSIEYADPETINGLNLYAYCANNPVMYFDPTGKFFITILAVLVGAGVAIGAAVGGISAAVNHENIWSGIWKGALVGGLFGVSAATIAIGVGILGIGTIGSSILIGAGVGSAYALATNLNSQLSNGGFGSLNMKSLGMSWVAGFGVGALSGAMGYVGKIIGSTFGQMLGIALSGKYIIGTLVSKIISTGFLTGAGTLIGGALGGYLFSKFINDLATDSGMQNNNIPLWIGSIIKAFFKR